MTELMTTRETAARLRVSPRFILRETQAGRLRAIEYRTSSRSILRYRPEDVVAWLERYAHARGARRDDA